MRRHRLIGLLLPLLAGVGLVVAGNLFAADDDPKVKPLIWGADAEGGAPYIFADPDQADRYIGFEVDLKEALARELGRPIEFRQTDFASGLLPALKRGDIDFAMNGLEVTPDRKRQVRFSRPYYYYQLQLVARDGEDRFQSLEDLQKKPDLKVGTLENTAASRLLAKMGIKSRDYPDQVGPFKDLADKQLDAVLLDLPIALYYAQKDPKLRYASANPKLTFVGRPFAPGEYAIAFLPKEEKLANDFDAALDRLAKRGDLKRIYEKWGLWNDSQKQELPPSEEDAPSQFAGYRFDGYFPLLLRGARETVYLSVMSMLAAIALGLATAAARLYGPLPIRVLALVYVEFFRGIPVLLLLVAIYYGLPTMGIKLRADHAAILAFGLNYAAYEAEIYRAGLQAVPRGQWEAAASLGMSDETTFRRIILPQALRSILPPMTNDFIALFKDTSVVSVIGVIELTKQYQILSRTFDQYLEIGLATAILYLMSSVPLGYLSRSLEKRWGRGHA